MVGWGSIARNIRTTDNHASILPDSTTTPIQSVICILPLTVCLCICMLSFKNKNNLYEIVWIIDS